MQEKIVSTNHVPDTVLSPDTSSVCYQNRQDHDSPAAFHLGGGDL